MKVHGILTKTMQNKLSSPRLTQFMVIIINTLISDYLSININMS